MAKNRHKYEYAAKSNSSASKVARLTGVKKRVLELGSGPGMITRLLKESQCRVTALELDTDALELVSPFCEAVHLCDLNDPAWPTKLAGAEKFEVIVAGDVLEHLYDPCATLNRLTPLLAAGGHIVVSLPHVGHNAVIACLMAGDFEYQPWGLLDKTHIRFFGIKNIQTLLNNAGFKIVEVDYVIRTPVQTEFARRWRQLPAPTRQALAYNKFGTIYQVVLKAVPASAEGKGLDIASLPVPPPVAVAFSSGLKGNALLSFFVSNLSLDTRRRISQFLTRVGFRL